jgi:hypothetical protein
MKTRASITALAFALGAATLAACATETSVTQLWSAPIPVSRPPMRKIVVMATQMDEANRRSLEDSLVHALSAHQVQAIPSYKLFSDKLPEIEEAQKAVQALGVDGILTANFKGIKEQLSYVPGYYAGGFWGGYYGSGYGYTGGHVYTDQVVNLETALWDARANNDVVWAALTQTMNPSNGQDFVVSVTKKVIPTLANAHFIPASQKKED